MMKYEDFLRNKAQCGENAGFKTLWMPESAFDFQKALIDYAVEKGRAAVWAECGLGKTLIQLAWAENVHRKTNKPVLILTPLAVSHQTCAEAEKFGMEARRTQNGKVHNGINVTNYERLHLFKSDDFSGAVCDESGCLKSFSGVRRSEIVEFMHRLPYRHLCTATAAPNDYVELGNSSEALGYLGFMDMLNRFFKNDQNNSAVGKRFHGEAVRWRFKGHAELPFWRWVCSWARAMRKPSDLGFDDGPFILPPLDEREHIIHARKLAEGMLFSLQAHGLREQREERRRTILERCEKIAELVNDTGKPALVWCNLNAEGDLLEKLIPDAIQIAGSDSDDVKEQRLIAFATGQERVCISKGQMIGWGLNLQHCAHIAGFIDHSFEKYYQGVRRCHRFLQKNPVIVDLVLTEGELSVLRNLKRKKQQAEEMFANLVTQMNNAENVVNKQYAPTIDRPDWLKRHGIRSGIPSKISRTPSRKNQGTETSGVSKAS